jgi:hypothetical protein
MQHLEWFNLKIAGPRSSGYSQSGRVAPYAQAAFLCAGLRSGRRYSMKRFLLRIMSSPLGTGEPRLLRFGDLTQATKLF